jgi:hypothetical protein
VLNSFYEAYQRPFSANIEGDVDNLIKLKKTVFEKLKFNEDLFSDSFLAEYLNYYFRFILIEFFFKFVY